jgi:phosphoglycerate dehydrogenase-like enzyme
MLAVVRGIQIGKKYINAGNAWNDPNFLGVDINGSTIGIIGYGHIAKKTIRKLQGFDSRKILVFTETKKHEKPEFSNKACPIPNWLSALG